MLLDTDNDIIENGYAKWFDQMYTSFEKQIKKQLKDYVTGLNTMVFAYEIELLKNSFPFKTLVRFKRKYQEDEKYVNDLIFIDIAGPEEKYIKDGVSYAMKSIIENPTLVWTKIEPLEVDD